MAKNQCIEIDPDCQKALEHPILFCECLYHPEEATLSHTFMIVIESIAIRLSPI